MSVAVACAAEVPVKKEMFVVKISSDRVGRFFTPDEPIELVVNVSGGESESRQLEADIQLLDFDGRTVALKQQAVEQGAVALRFDSPGEGFYRASVTVKADGQEIGQAQASIGVVPAAEERETLQESPFGVIGALNRAPTDELETRVQLMARAGIRWVREGFLWDRIEPVEGQQNWEHFDRLVDTCHRYGIDVLPVLAYGTRWASTAPQDKKARTTMPRLEEWRKYLEAVVTRYKGRIHAYEVWNEPNSITFFQVAQGDSQAKKYAELLAFSYGIIKGIDRDARVLNGGFTPKHWVKERPDLHEALFMQEIYDYSPVPFDVAATHPYTSPTASTTNRQTTDKLEHLAGFVRDVVVEKGEAAKPMWFTEYGVPIQEGVMTEERAADYAVIVMVHSLSMGYVEKAFLYNLRNDGTDPKDKEQNFGLLNHDLSPKPAYFAYRNLIRLLEGARFVELQRADGVAKYVFESPAGQVLVLWSEDDESREVSIEAASTEVFDVIGRRASLAAGQGKVTVTPSPRFVVITR